MQILFLGPECSPVRAQLAALGETVRDTADPIDAATVEAWHPDFIVSDRFRHIVRNDVLSLLPGRVINLHISLLPFNRGADPNLWSWIEDTPKGVTIHHMDEHLDTGDVIAQREVGFGPGETLASSYARLQDEMAALFADQWPLIRAGTAARTPQGGPGTSHRLADRAAVEHLLTAGWDTPVAQLRRG